MSGPNLVALESRIEELEIRIAELTPPKLMTALDICELLSISERQFYEWKRAGDAPAAIYFSDRTVRYDRDDVMPWVKSKQVG